MSARTASKAGRFPWMSESRATRRGGAAASHSGAVSALSTVSSEWAVIAFGCRWRWPWRWPRRGSRRSSSGRAEGSSSRPPSTREPTSAAEQLDRARGLPRAAAASGARRRGCVGPRRWGPWRLRPPRPFARLCGRVEARPLAGGAAVGASIVLVLTVVALPFGRRGDDRAVDVGLSTQAWASWLSDVGKSAAVERRLRRRWRGSSLVALIRRFPRGWWTPAGGRGRRLRRAGHLPVADRARPAVQPLRAAARGRAARRGARAGRAGGRRRRRGLPRRRQPPHDRRPTPTWAASGETKRVVLYDNLIEDLPQEQVRSVVAHELGHVRYRDLPRGLAVARDRGARSDAGWCSGSPSDDRRSRPDRAMPRCAGAPAALPALALSLAVVAFAVQIPANWLSRAGGGARRRLRARPDRATRRPSSGCSGGLRCATSPTRTRRR